MFSIKCTELLCHTENCTCTNLQRRFIDHSECSDQPSVRCDRLFYFQRTELAVTFQNDINLHRVPITVEIQIWLLTSILITFYNLGHREIFQQCAVHGTTLGHLRRGPFCQIADKPSVIKVHLGRFNGTFQHIVGVWVQQKDNPQGFKDIDPCFCRLYIDIRIIGKGLVIKQLRSPRRCRGDKPVELQRVYRPGNIVPDSWKCRKNNKYFDPGTVR